MSNSLRPRFFNDFVGQAPIIATLSVVIRAANAQKKYFGHILFTGPSGYGKTTLATIMANETKRNIKSIQGPALLKKGDVILMLASITEGCIIFIDEVHSVSEQAAELLYSVMEDGFIELPLGVEGNSKFMRMQLPSFSLIAATTYLNRVARPLRNRFSLILEMSHYSVDDLLTIAQNSATQLGVNINSDAAEILVRRASASPRLITQMVTLANDFRIDANLPTIDKAVVTKMFTQVAIDEYGLSPLHVKYLMLLEEENKAKWMSLTSITSLLTTDREFVEMELETPLIKLGFIAKSSRGRTITARGQIYLHEHLPKA